MAKKDFKADALNAFDLPERPLIQNGPPTDDKPGPKPAAANLKKPSVKTTSVSIQKPAEKPLAKTKDFEQDTLIRRTYYISKAQYKALKLLAATSEMSEEKDISAIVRSAIDMYLAKKRGYGTISPP